MSNTSNYIKSEPIREIAASALTSSYAVLGTPLVHRSYVITIVNGTNGDVYLTRDTTQNEKRFLPNSGKVCDYKSDDSVEGRGTQYYVKWAGTAPVAPSGNFWVEVEYV